MIIVFVGTKVCFVREQIHAKHRMVFHESIIVPMVIFFSLVAPLHSSIKPSHPSYLRKTKQNKERLELKSEQKSNYGRTFFLFINSLCHVLTSNMNMHKYNKR